MSTLIKNVVSLNYLLIDYIEFNLFIFLSQNNLYLHYILYEIKFLLLLILVNFFFFFSICLF
jgi:hypothetical protein